MQLVCKVGTRYPDPKNPGHHTSWRDGQIIEHTYNNHIALGSLQSMHHCVINIPNADYWKLRGSTDWKSTKSAVMNLKKYLCSTDLSGKYCWELTDSGLHIPKRKRDFFVDYKWLLQEGYITQSQYEDIYNQDKVADIQLSILDWTEILKHEDYDTHLDNTGLLTKGSIASGTYQIGTGGGADYATWTLFEADIAAQMTGDLTGEGQDEETVISARVEFDVDTNTYLLKSTAESGAEHDGTFPVGDGDGAWISMGTYDYFNFDSTNLKNVEISKLAFDIAGNGNIGINVEALDGEILLNRLLIVGDADSLRGINLLEVTNGVVNCRNNIVYGVGAETTEGGILVRLGYTGTAIINLYNNTCIKNYNNFIQNRSGTNDTFVVKNNIAQDNTGGSDFLDAGAGFGTHAKNISEDATSPDAAYQSKDLHTNSVFVDYDGDNFKIDKDGDSTNLAIVDDGEDLSGIFTDDINHDAGRRP